MKKSWALLVALCLFSSGIIIGSFYDWEISRTLFANREPFSITVTALGLIPAYGFTSFIGGILLRHNFQFKYPKWMRAILIILAAVGLGAGTYFSSNEFFSVNGFNKPGIGMTFLALGISLVIHSGIFVFGFFAGKGIKNKNAWIGILILAAAFIISTVPCVQILKNAFHRPRYRTVQLYIENLEFHQWWEPLKNYKDFIVGDITKEEFKSYPSGHAAVSAAMAFFLYMLSYCFPKLKKHGDLLFAGGILYCLLVCYARIRVGAHCMSDVSFGGLLTIVLMGAGFMVVEKLKLFEEPVIENITYEKENNTNN